MPLVFPGSGRKKGEDPRDPYELPFRDGKRSVPPYLAELMSGMDTIRYTYSDAVDRVNQRLTVDFANSALAKTIATHFSELER
jgi:hypothetical protein